MDIYNASICQLLLSERRLAYILTDQQLRLQMCFDPLHLLNLNSDVSAEELRKISLYDTLPFLVGYEDQLEAIAQGSQERLELACVQQQEAQMAGRYLRLVTLPYHHEGTSGIIQFVEDIQQEGEMEQMLRQQRNELSLSQDNLLESNAALLSNNMQLEQAVKTREEFLAMISHELRTPLTSVLGMVEVLQQELCGPVNGEQNELLSIITDNWTFAKFGGSLPNALEWHPSEKNMWEILHVPNRVRKPKTLV